MHNRLVGVEEFELAQGVSEFILFFAKQNQLKWIGLLAIVVGDSRNELTRVLIGFGTRSRYNYPGGRQFFLRLAPSSTKCALRYPLMYSALDFLT